MFIHVGYHKTATTFLQKRVFPHLNMTRWIMPRVDYVAEAHSFDPSRFKEILAGGSAPDPGRSCLLSSEVLSGRADGDPRWDPFRIADRLAATFPEAKILVVIRNQLDYLVSLYCFRVCVRGLETRSLDAFLQSKFRAGLDRKLRYHELLQRYRDLFGEGRVLALCYEQLREDPEKFVNRVLAFMGETGPLRPQGGSVNEGVRGSNAVLLNRVVNYPAGALIGALRWVPAEYLLENAYFAVKDRAMNRFLRGGRWAGPPVDLNEEWKRSCAREFGDSNRKLMAQLDLDLNRYGYPIES